MKTEVNDIWDTLKEQLASLSPSVQVRVDKETNFEVAGTKPVMQGKQQVDGHYFANIVPKPKDIRLYFFPIYTHSTEFDPLSPELQRSLKGKSCFHIKKLSPEMEAEIARMLKHGLELYQRDGLV